jgi:hypothetical protein
MYFDNPESAEILAHLNHQHPLMQYWTMIGLQYQNHLDQSILPALKVLASQPESLVSVTAAETLCMFGHLDQIRVLTNGLSSKNPYLQLMSARAFELIKDKPGSAMEAGKQAWLRLGDETTGKWKGYDLYAYWSLSQVFGSD